MKKIILLSIIISSSFTLYGQKGHIIGKILNADKTPLSNVNVTLTKTNKGTITNSSGEFEIKNIPNGSYKLKVSHLGFAPQQKNVTISKEAKLIVNFVLIDATLNLKEVSVTATGVRKSTQDIAGAVSILDSKSITESGAQNIGEIITRAPGVNFLDEDGRGLKPNIGLRGLNPNRDRNVLVLVDGKFPVGMTLYGDPAGYYFMPLQQVDRVEIIKGGAASVLYGGYSVGGVVNLISKKATYEPETRAELSYGSWNGLVAQLTSGQDNGKFSYYLNATRRQGDSFRKNGKFNVNDITAKISARPDSTSEVSVYINAFSEDSETPGGISPDQFKNDVSQSNNPHDHFFSKRFSGAFSYSKTMNSFNSLSLSIYGNYFERNWFIGTTNPARNGFVRDIHNTGLVADYNLSKELFGLKNSLIVGTRIHTDRLDDIRIAQSEGDFTSKTGLINRSRVNTSYVFELYAYDELYLMDKLIFTPGARFTSIKYKRKDLTANRQDISEFDQFVYTAGLVYKLKPKTSIYTNIATGFQPPQLNSSLDPGTIDNNVDLGAETSVNYEIGIKTSPVDWLQASLTAYTFKFQNKIVKESGVSKNAGESLHRGLEAELELGSFNGFSIFTNFTFQKATFGKGDTSIEGNILPYAPQQMFATGLRYKAPLEKGALVGNIFMNYVGKQYNDNLNTEAESADGKNGALPAYKVVNATLSYSAEKWGINLSIFNLLDERYFNQRNKFFGGIMPSPPRNLRMSLFYKF